jgi:hypothetical protein
MDTPRGGQVTPHPRPTADEAVPPSPPSPLKVGPESGPLEIPQCVTDQSFHPFVHSSTCSSHFASSPAKPASRTQREPNVSQITARPFFSSSSQT